MRVYSALAPVPQSWPRPGQPGSRVPPVSGRPSPEPPPRLLRAWRVRRASGFPSLLDEGLQLSLHRPQRAQRRLLRLGQSLHPADIEALVGPVAPQRPQMLAALEIPDVNGPIIAATGEPLAIGTHSERLDCPLMPLPKRQALPALHVPPAHAPIAAATEQHRSRRTPGQRVHDRARLPPGMQALLTGHLPDEDFPTASSAPTATGQLRAIGTPGHAPD